VLLKERGANVKQQDSTGNTALFWAAQTKGGLRVLDSPARMVTSEIGRNFQRCLEYLINLDLDIHHEDKHHQTPLHMAAASGDHIRVRTLMALVSEPSVFPRELADWQSREETTTTWTATARTPSTWPWKRRIARWRPWNSCWFWGWACMRARVSSLGTCQALDEAQGR